MKNISLATFVLILTSINLSAQDYTAEIRTATSSYFEATQNLDIDSIIEGIYPKMFEYVPKEIMKSQMKTTFENEEMKIGFKDFEIQKIYEKTVEYEEEIFGLVETKMVMTMEFEDKSGNEFIKTSLDARYGEEKVDLTKGVFSVNTVSRSFAIKSEGKWYFIEDKPELEQVIGNMIPEKVRTAFEK